MFLKNAKFANNWIYLLPKIKILQIIVNKINLIISLTSPSGLLIPDVISFHISHRFLQNRTEMFTLQTKYITKRIFSLFFLINECHQTITAIALLCL